MTHTNQARPQYEFSTDEEEDFEEYGIQDDEDDGDELDEASEALNEEELIYGESEDD